MTGWKDDVQQALEMARGFDPLTRQAVNFYVYATAIPNGAMLPDATACGMPPRSWR